MIIEALGLSLIVGKLRKGKIKNLGFFRIKGSGFIFFSFIINIASILIAKQENFLSIFINENFIYIRGLAYILLLIGIGLNIEELGMKIIFAGTILNFICIIFNKGKMPVAINEMNGSYFLEQIRILKENKLLTHTFANSSTNLYYLSDIIPISKPYFFPKMISIGDILISLGIFILIQKWMINKRFNSFGKNIEI
mgnify:CR=1 FL=1